MLVGGRGGTSRLATVEQYNPVSNSWQSMAALNTARSGHTASLLVGNALLLIGGLDNSGRLAQNEYFDRERNLWIEANNLAVARNGHASSILSPRLLLVTGGSGSDGGSLTSVELYDPGVELVEDPDSDGGDSPPQQPNLRDAGNNIYIPIVQ